MTDSWLFLVEKMVGFWQGHHAASEQELPLRYLASKFFARNPYLQEEIRGNPAAYRDIIAPRLRELNHFPECRGVFATLLGKPGNVLPPLWPYMAEGVDLILEIELSRSNDLRIGLKGSWQDDILYIHVPVILAS